MLYGVTCFEAAKLPYKKAWRQVQCKGELWQKFMNNYKHSANIKVFTLKQYKLDFQMPLAD